MALTLEHFLNLIDELPKGVNLDYVKAGTNKSSLTVLIMLKNTYQQQKLIRKKVLQKVPI